MKSNTSILRLVTSVVLVMIIGSFFVFHVLNKQESRLPIVTNRQSSIPALQILQNIYIDSDERSPLIAIQGKLMFIGSKSPNDLPRLIALDENTGNLIWQYGNNNETTLTASDTIVYVGEVGSITAINPNTGKIIWTAYLPPASKGVHKLLVWNNILYADTIGGDYFLLEAKTGRVIQSISYAIDGVPNKDIPDWSDHKLDLDFVGSIGYFQKQTGYPDYEGEIIALDISGNQIWSSGSLSAASRIAASSLGVFVLGLDGKLLKFNLAEGSKEEVIQFTPRPVLRDDKEGWSYGYYVSVDVGKQLLFVYMGDSAQLFVFQLPVLP